MYEKTQVSYIFSHLHIVETFPSDVLCVELTRIPGNGWTGAGRQDGLYPVTVVLQFARNYQRTVMVHAKCTRPYCRHDEVHLCQGLQIVHLQL